MSLKLYQHALMDLGLHELPGPESAPRIALAIRVAASWLDRDDSETAWCGCIRGLWGLETGTGVPTEHYRAAAWMRWGKVITLKEARQGDTVVLQRTGGFHVGLLDRVPGPEEEDGRVWVLGGNQGNRAGSTGSVSIAPFERRLVVGVRRAA